MSEIAHVMPIDLRPLNGAGEGVVRPGLKTTEFAGGGRSTCDLSEYNLRTYAWNLGIFGSSTTKLAQFEAWLRHIACGGNIAYVREALGRWLPEVPISPLADGTLTSFVLPVRYAGLTPGDFVVLDNGEYQTGGTDFSLHGYANILTDDQANAVDGTTGIEAHGAVTVAQAAYPVADGMTAFKVTPAGAAANLGLKTTVAGRPACDASQEYTFLVAVRGAGDFQLDAEFYDGVPAQTGATASDTCTGTTTGWSIMEVQSTSAVDAETAHLEVYRTTSSSAVFHVACLGIIPGDLATWFLPSEAPAVIEFTSAPTARDRITVSGTFTWMARARLLAQRGATWRLNSPGHVSGAQFQAVEELSW